MAGRMAEMEIQIEFFGIARQRSGAARTTVRLSETPATLGTTLRQLGRTFPNFAAECLTGEQLKPEYLVSLHGDRFVRDPRTPLHDGDCLLIMSADAGG